MIQPQSDPFFLPGNAHGCLLIHGFSGSPAEMRGLGDFLHAQGYTVQGVRLAGHSGKPEDLAATRWRDWYASAESGLHDLRKQCATVTVIGFSLGGALSVLLNKRHLFEQLVLLATPLRLQGDWRLNILPVARYVVPWYYPLEQVDFADPLVQQRMRAFDTTVNLEDPAVQRKIRRSVKISVSAINELQQALRQAHAALPQVHIPTLVMHGCLDTTVPPTTADEIVAQLGSTAKTQVRWQHTDHQMLVSSPERAAVYKQIADFIDHGLC